jgi:hypothetical protein
MEIEPEQHRQTKILATFAGMTIKEFILSKTLTPSRRKPQQSEDTTARLLGSPKNAKRLREAITSQTPECPECPAGDDKRKKIDRIFMVFCLT